MATQFLFFLMLPFLLFASSPTFIPVFDPPVGWECAFPENISHCIQVGFIGNGSGNFRPSINLAVEEVDVNLKQYIRAVKDIHLAENGTTWRDLGKFRTHSGEGRLTEISTTSPVGLIKMLQMIVVSGKTAYIFTGAAIKEDFLQCQETFLKTFQSFRLVENLFSLLPSEKKFRFEAFFSKLGSSTGDDAEKEAKWIDLQKLVLQEVPEMGSYWQILVLKSGREKIYR